MIVFGKVLRGDSHREQPLMAPIYPVTMPFLPVILIVEEILHLHLLELTTAKSEIARGDFITEGLAHLGNAERYLDAAGIENGLEINEYPLGGLGPQVSDGGGVLQRAHVRLEHHVEIARRGETA